MTIVTRQTHDSTFLLTIGALLFFFTNCISSSYKPSSIQDVIRSRLNTLKEIRDKAINRQGDTSALVVKGREYGGGYGGGGMASYSSNYDTALTALAFLSFGVYLLNLLLMAMNRTAGRKRRDLEWEYEEGDVTSFQELMSVLGESVSSYLFGVSSPECSEKYLCVVKETIKSHSYSDNWFSANKGLLKVLSYVNLPGVNFITDLSDDEYCKNTTSSNNNNCLFLHNLENSLKKVKNNNKDNKLLPSDLLLSGKGRKMKRNSPEESNLNSLWGIIQFLYQVLTPT